MSGISIEMENLDQSNNLSLPGPSPRDFEAGASAICARRGRKFQLTSNPEANRNVLKSERAAQYTECQNMSMEAQYKAQIYKGLHMTINLLCIIMSITIAVLGFFSHKPSVQYVGTAIAFILSTLQTFSGVAKLEGRSSVMYSSSKTLGRIARTLQFMESHMNTDDPTELDLKLSELCAEVDDIDVDIFTHSFNPFRGPSKKKSKIRNEYTSASSMESAQN